MRFLTIVALLTSSVLCHAQTSVKVDEQNVDAETEVLSVNVDEGGVNLKAPGTAVDVDGSGVNLSAPGVGVDVTADGVVVDVAGVSVDVSGVASGVQTNSVEGRSETREDAPAPAEMRNISVSVGQKNYACTAGEGVSIKSTSSIYNITGPCDTVRVSGTGNVVNIDQVRRIELQGTGNALTWKRSYTEKAPITLVSGIGNSIDRQ
jgi:hypothetical protein